MVKVPVAGHSGFPAPHRAGLIEADTCAGRTARPGAFPAPHRAGLIEAGRFIGETICRFKFPAPHRAGLIEATACTEPATRIPAACFRLLTEPASLKPPVRDPVLRLLDLLFPAPHRAGLIEARSARRAANAA